MFVIAMPCVSWFQHTIFFGSEAWISNFLCQFFFSLYIWRIPNNGTDRNLLWRSLVPFSTLYFCLFIWWVFRFDVHIHILGLCFKPLYLFVFCYRYRPNFTLHLLRPSVPNAGGIQRVLVPKNSSFKTCSLGWTHHSWSRKRQIIHNHSVLKNSVHKHNRMMYHN